jgi:protein SCO1/2
MHRLSAIIALTATVALVGGTLGYIAWTRAGDPLAACRNGVVAGDIGGAFTLVDTAGREVTDQTLFTRPTLLYFGYASCPDICPLDNARNVAAVDILQEQGYDVQPVFVSVDPARDTAEVLDALSANLHPDMVALTGSDAQVAQAAQAFRVIYRLEPPEEDGFYLVSHTSMTYLVLPGGIFADFFRRDASPEDVATRTACFIDAAAA